MHRSSVDRTILLSLVLASALLSGCRGPVASEPGEGIRIEVKADKLRPKPGETVRIDVGIEPSGAAGSADLLALLLVPAKGARDLALLPAGKPGRFFGEVRLDPGSPEGFYGITVTGRSRRGPAFGKGSFIFGKVVGDFLIASALPSEDTAGDLAAYAQGFLAVGGNMIVVHDIINKKAWYPSKVCANAALPGAPDDRVGTALRVADALGLPALITVVWDMTKIMPYAEYTASMKAVMAELWELYAAHPSLLGFYDYQEGSGTYFAAHVREFADAVKALNPGLLAGCAPYVDDPLLAGYLAAIDSLDIAIYQGAVMASYRPDNRKCFPIRRTADFAALSAGAMLQKGKIALSHVELFGYLERAYAGEYLAGPEDARDQILSAASCSGPDGVTLFTYHYNIHEMGKTAGSVKEISPAVAAGLEAFSLIAGRIAGEPGPVGVYIPYSDWWVDRWTESILPALDAFRRLGVPAAIVPFIPPKGEEILPYYPYHANEEQIERLLREKTVLVLPDVAGMQDTDGRMLKAFVERGGTALLFGPRIPFGDGFDRDALVGGRERPAKTHTRVEVREPLFSRAGKSARFRIPDAARVSWIPTTARAAAVFEDGAAAVLVNSLGQGAVISVPYSLAEASKAMPELVRDIFDFALARHGLKRPFDIDGVEGDMDVAVTSGNGDPAAAVMNYGTKPVGIVLSALNLEPGRTYAVVELASGARTARIMKDLSSWRMKVPAHGFIAVRVVSD